MIWLKCWWNNVDIHSIVPVGQDPHEYEVKPKDIKS